MSTAMSNKCNTVHNKANVKSPFKATFCIQSNQFFLINIKRNHLESGHNMFVKFYQFNWGKEGGWDVLLENTMGSHKSTFWGEIVFVKILMVWFSQQINYSS